MASEPPPPYQACDSSTPAPISASSHPATFHIECPKQRDYYIYSGPDKDTFLNVQTNEWISSDLAFHSSNAPNRELLSCNFKETTCSVDKADIKTQIGQKETLWWAACIDPKIPISVQYRFKARVQNPANPFAGIAGVNATSPRCFDWYCHGGSEWRLVDELIGAVAAVVRDVDFAAGVYGSIEILLSYGDTFSLIVFSSYLTICEKLKREAKKHWIW
ncbi:hypothetical protein N7490_007507 [Penicillium lividum]|nr:hypothetical protein N7490_007507 [Penicillium lividum]